MNSSTRAEIEHYWNYNESDLLMSLVPGDQRRAIAEDIYAQAEGRHIRGEGFPIPAGEEEKIIDGEVRTRGTTLVREVSGQVKEFLCAEFRYCEKRELLSHDGVSLAAAIADALLAVGLGIPVPVTAFSVYVIKYQVLDRLCDCPKPLPSAP